MLAAGRVVGSRGREFSPEARRAIRHETLTDVIDCVLGVVFCTASILVVISALGRHWTIFALSLLAGLLRRWIVHDAMVAARRFRSLSFEAKEPLPEVRRKELLPKRTLPAARKRDDSLFAGQRSIDHSVRPVPVSFEHACQPVNRAASRRACCVGAHPADAGKTGLGASVC